MTQECLERLPSGATLREACFSANRKGTFIVVANGNYYVVGTGLENRRFAFAEHLAMSHDGRTSACRVKVDEGEAIVVNNEVGSVLKWVSDPVMSEGGEVAYWAMMHGNENSECGSQDGYCVVTPEGVGAPHNAPGQIAFGPRQGACVYSVQEQGSSYIVQNGKRGTCFDWIIDLRFNPATGDTWYWGEVGGRWQLMREADVFDVSNDICDQAGPVFSADGQHLAYWRRTDRGWEVIVDGKCIGSADEPWTTPVFGVSGSVAYSASRGRRAFVAVDGHEGERFDAVGLPVFSDDGLKVGYKARQGETEFVVVSEKCGHGYSASRQNDELLLWGKPTFSADGQHVAYIAEYGGRECVMIDDSPSDWCDYVSGIPVFGGDNVGDIAYGRVHNRMEAVCFGESRSSEFDQIWPISDQFDTSARWIPTFTQNKVICGARSDQAVFWVSIEAS